MTQGSLWAKLLGFVAATMITSCANAPPITSVTDLSARTCQSAPDLASSRTLALPAKDSEKLTLLTVTIDERAPCIEEANGRRAYQLFELPETEEGYVLQVASYPAGTVLFAPVVFLLNESGVQLREIPRETYVFRGGALTVQWRSHLHERYLLLTSDPSLVGQSIQRSTADVQRTVIAAGAFFVPVASGTDKTFGFTYAHSGRVAVSVARVPSIKDN